MQSPPRRYAQDTTVSTEKSRYEIETILKRHGASQFMYASEVERSIVMCRLAGRMLRFEIPHVLAEDCAKGPHRKRRNPDAAAENENRRRWRALLLIVKAKLEMVAAGLSTVEREFLADVLLPDGSTVADFIGPALAEAYETGKMASMPGLLLGKGDG